MFGCAALEREASRGVRRYSFVDTPLAFVRVGAVSEEHLSAKPDI